MRKIFTSMMLLVCSLAAMATDYPGTLAVVVDGNVAQPTQTQITLDKQEDSKYTLSLKNFILVQGEDMMPVGNIVLKDVVAVEEDGVVTLETVQDILIEDGDLVYIPMWIGPMLGPVPVELKATLNGDVLSADITIPLVSLGQNIKVVFDSRTFQLPNSGFENFHTATAGKATSDEPNNWHSFMSCTGSLASMVSSVPHTFISDDVRPGSTGSKSVLVKSGKVLGMITANGTLTTGQLNAGGMSATDTKNNAFIDFSNSATDANGDPFYTVLNTLPDSIAVWMKFKQGSPVTAHPYATMSAVITDGSYYQEPQDKDYSDIIVGQAGNNTIESTGEWQKIVVPFEYLNIDKSPKGILVTFSTNADPGQGTGDDELYIDDVELIYSSYLSGLMVNGETLPGFASDKYEYEYSFGDQKVPTEDELAKMIGYVVAGNEAKGFVSVSENVASILVLSADLMSNRTYTITFTGADEPESHVVLSNYALASDGEYDEDGDVKVAVTYDAEITGKYAESFGLSAGFTYVVSDSEGEIIIADGYRDVAEVAAGTANIYISGLQSQTEYTITVTGVTVYDYASDEWIIFTEEGTLATLTFTTGNIAEASYVKLSNYALASDGEYDEDGDVKVVVTYDAEIVGEYVESFGLSAVFTYEVSDSEGEIIIADGYRDVAEVAAGTANIYISGLQSQTEYTITVTSVTVYDYASDEWIIFTEEGELPSLTFTTGIPTGIANVEAVPAVKTDGKYLEDGQIVIYRNGVKYNAAGAVVK